MRPGTDPRRLFIAIRSWRIISLMSESSEDNESSGRNRWLPLMVELIYKKTNQWMPGRRKSMWIDPNKELTVAAPDSINSRSGVRCDNGGATDDGEHTAGAGCGRWQWGLERGMKSPAAAARELGRGEQAEMSLPPTVGKEYRSGLGSGRKTGDSQFHPRNLSAPINFLWFRHGYRFQSAPFFCLKP
jgi:hypothetical protein